MPIETLKRKMAGLREEHYARINADHQQIGHCTHASHQFRAPVPRRFALVREEDISGISGVGIVCFGVQFPDGTCSTRWNGEIAQTCVWKNVSEVIAIHGHGGATRLEWLDDELGGLLPA